MNKNSKGLAHFFPIFAIVVAGIVGLLYYSWQKGLIKTTPSTSSEAYDSKEVCEEETGKSCTFQNCDYIPRGKSFEEVCGKDFKKGWIPNQNSLIDEKIVNWKTYTNIKYGIEFKYPSYLSYVEQGPNLFQQKLDKGEQISGTIEPSLETVIFKDQKNAAQFVLGIFQISLKDISTNDYLNSFLYTRGDCDVRWGFEQSTTSMMDLSNPKVLKVTGKNPGFQSCYYLINQSGNLFAISTYSSNNQASFKTMESLLNQILSTFNFLEQSDVQKNIQWVTYNNSEYGFTFQYPSEMTLEIDGGKEGFYDLVAEFVTSDYGVSVKAIHNIDIYDNAETQFVAGREISDSGFTYSLTDSIINGLSATTTTVDSQSKLRIVTIAHSTKNLFIEISFTGARQQLDSEILSTFKFID